MEPSTYVENVLSERRAERGASTFFYMEPCTYVENVLSERRAERGAILLVLVSERRAERRALYVCR